MNVLNLTISASVESISSEVFKYCNNTENVYCCVQS
jgi:hypothetical protein